MISLSVRGGAQLLLGEIVRRSGSLRPSLVQFGSVFSDIDEV